MSTPSFPPLRRRPARVVPSVLVGLLGLTAAGLLAWAAVLRFTQGSWPEPVATGAPAVLETPVTDPRVLAAGIVLTVLGLVLLLCGLVPGRYRGEHPRAALPQPLQVLPAAMLPSGIGAADRPGAVDHLAVELDQLLEQGRDAVDFGPSQLDDVGALAHRVQRAAWPIGSASR